ncbi:MAG: formyltetrahydrofolate deformylase [Saprospiraceae bacterium]
MDTNHVIRIQCADKKGLIAKISGILFENNHNVLVMKEYVDEVTNSFFARLELTGELNVAKLAVELKTLLPQKAIISIIPRKKKRIVILVTKEHHCLTDLLVRHHFNELHADIIGVIGNYRELEPFCAMLGIPFYLVSHAEKSKSDFEKELKTCIQYLSPDLIVLAKFMRILSADFVGLFEHRILNIHHSFLPAFVGANPYKRAFERGVKIIGATAHFVTNDLDEGPIISQKTIEVDHEHVLRDMIESGHEIEKAVLAEALKIVLEDKVFVSGNKTIILD